MVTLFLGRISRTGKEVGKSTDPTRERGGRKKKKKRKSGISQGTVKTRRSNELRRRRGQIQKGKKRQDSRGRTSENILANI